MLLIDVIKKYTPNQFSFPDRLSLQLILQNWSEEQKIKIEVIDSGSLAKGTAISLSSDIDFLISYFDSNDDSTLKDRYNSLYEKFRASGYSTKKQNVSIRITFPQHQRILLGVCFQVDLTPAKKHILQKDDHSLWVSKQGTWKKTNVKKHIGDVSNSGCINEIKLLKIWRERNKLDFPSIYLEYLIIEMFRLRKIRGATLEDTFWCVLLELARDNDNPLFLTIRDPANFENKISDLITISEKNNIISVAKNSTKPNQSWSDIVW